MSGRRKTLRQRGGSEEFFNRAKSHNLKPTIVNAESKFVVITYWWGRGNLNKNTQRPCPEDLGEGQSLTRMPIKYEQMIADWENACAKQGCNYLAEEYPEFAVKGGYQHAINFKPYFIELALEACSPRSVLYIDGDMKIKVYPGICDTHDIDYMARGWNADPRPSNWKKSGKFCFDPYVFEMSGGTMFFGNTSHGRSLLKLWQKETKRYPGKAYDRILSLTIMRYKLLVALNTIQLPLEYLWLDLDYDDYLEPKVDYRKAQVSVTHPECLTGEDRASSEGAAANRYPFGYDRYVSELINCGWEEIYEYIHFEDKSRMGPFKTLFKFLEKHGIADIIPFKHKYGGRFNKIAAENEEMMKKVQVQGNSQLVTLTPDLLESKSMLIPTILKHLENGQNVLYVPDKPTSVHWVLEKVDKQGLDFVTRNLSKNLSRSKPEYYLELDTSYPIYFGARSATLKHLLRMSDSLKGMQKVFNHSYIFLTRIRCGWI